MLIACVRMFVDSAQSGRHKALVQATPARTRRPKREEFRSQGEGCKVHTGLFQLFLYVKSKSTCVNNAWLGTHFHGFDAPLTADQGVYLICVECVVAHHGRQLHIVSHQVHITMTES